MPTRQVTVRLISAGSDTGPFDIISGQTGNTLYTGVTRESIMSPTGLQIDVPYETLNLILQSTGVCTSSKLLELTSAPPLLTRYYELVPCDSQLPNAYTKLTNTLPNNRYVKAGMIPTFYVYQGAYIDSYTDPSGFDSSIVPATGIGCA